MKNWQKNQEVQKRAEKVLPLGVNSNFRYWGEETCATDGLCATACPVGIDTGDLTRRLRGRKLGETPFAGVELPVGRHVLTFKNPGKRPVTRTCWNSQAASCGCQRARLAGARRQRRPWASRTRVRKRWFSGQPTQALPFQCRSPRRLKSRPRFHSRTTPPTA